MKIKLTFKTPDVLEQITGNVPDDMIDEAQETIEKFVRHNEYITVEFDTVSKTCIILQVK